MAKQAELQQRLLHEFAGTDRCRAELFLLGMLSDQLLRLLNGGCRAVAFHTTIDYRPVVGILVAKLFRALQGQRQDRARFELYDLKTTAGEELWVTMSKDSSTMEELEKLDRISEGSPAWTKLRTALTGNPEGAMLRWDSSVISIPFKEQSRVVYVGSSRQRFFEKAGLITARLADDQYSVKFDDAELVIKGSISGTDLTPELLR